MGMDFELLVRIFPEVLLDGIILGFMYALIALGYTMVYGVLEFINFAHSEIFIAGAFVGVEILLGLQGRGLLDGLPVASRRCCWYSWPAWPPAGSWPSRWSGSPIVRCAARPG